MRSLKTISAILMALLIGLTSTNIKAQDGHFSVQQGQSLSGDLLDMVLADYFFWESIGFLPPEKWVGWDEIYSESWASEPQNDLLTPSSDSRDVPNWEYEEEFGYSSHEDFYAFLKMNYSPAIIRAVTRQMDWLIDKKPKLIVFVVMVTLDNDSSVIHNRHKGLQPNQNEFFRETANFSIKSLMSNFQHCIEVHGTLGGESMKIEFQTVEMPIGAVIDGKKIVGPAGIAWYINPPKKLDFIANDEPRILGNFRLLGRWMVRDGFSILNKKIPLNQIDKFIPVPIQFTYASIKVGNDALINSSPVQGASLLSRGILLDLNHAYSGVKNSNIGAEMELIRNEGFYNTLAHEFGHFFGVPRKRS